MTRILKALYAKKTYSDKSTTLSLHLHLSVKLLEVKKGASALVGLETPVAELICAAVNSEVM